MFNFYRKWVWHRLNVLSSFRVYDKISNKLLVKLCFWSFWIFLKFYFFKIFAPQKPSKNIIIGPLNRCGIDWIHLCPLEYISNFLVKLCFGNFWIFLKSCSLFKIFAPHKPTRNYHRSLKEVWHKSNLFFVFIIHVKVFDKFVSLFTIL